MYNLVLLLMGVVIFFISFKNNKKILLKNIFIQKDVDLNSKKQCGIPFSLLSEEPFELHINSLSNFKSIPIRWVRLGQWPVLPKCLPGNSYQMRCRSHPWFGSLLFWYCGQLPQFKIKPWVPLAAPSGTGLAAFDLAWRILLSKELPLQIQIRSLNTWSEVVSNY